jgi:hypothetical protein
VLAPCKHVDRHLERGIEMRRAYSRPSLTEYGSMSTLTLGQHASSPDYNQDGTNYVNDNCTGDPGSGPGTSGDSGPFSCGTTSVGS